MCAWCSWRPEESSGSPGIGVTVVVSLREMLETKPGSLRKSRNLFTAEPALQPSSSFHQGLSLNLVLAEELVWLASAKTL